MNQQKHCHEQTGNASCDTGIEAVKAMSTLRGMNWE